VVKIRLGEAVDGVGVRSTGGRVKGVDVAAAARIAIASEDVVAVAARENVRAAGADERVVAVAAVHIRAGVVSARLEKVVAGHAPQLAAPPESAEQDVVELVTEAMAAGIASKFQFLEAGAERPPVGALGDDRVIAARVRENRVARDACESDNVRVVPEAAVEDIAEIVAE